MARKLRKGRDRCSGHRHDSEPCEAPAIPGGLVCLKHGGSAPQVRLAAERIVLLERRDEAYADWQAIHDAAPAGRMSMREVDALGRLARIERELEQLEADVTLIRLLQTEIRDPGGPGVRSMLLEMARARLAR